MPGRPAGRRCSTHCLREIPTEPWNDDDVLDLLRQLAYAKLMTQQHYNKIHFEGVIYLEGDLLQDIATIDDNKLVGVWHNSDHCI
eukprot:COSAG03_NODE_434_length_7933_cov_12.379755_6_plen_85_part_00